MVRIQEGSSEHVANVLTKTCKLRCPRHSLTSTAVVKREFFKTFQHTGAHSILIEYKNLPCRALVLIYHYRTLTLHSNNNTNCTFLSIFLFLKSSTMIETFKFMDDISCLTFSQKNILCYY